MVSGMRGLAGPPPAPAKRPAAETANPGGRRSLSTGGGNARFDAPNALGRPSRQPGGRTPPERLRRNGSPRNDGEAGNAEEFPFQSGCGGGRCRF